MKEEDKTKGQLLAEIQGLRRKIAEYEGPHKNQHRMTEQITNAKQELEQTFDAVPDLIAMIDRQYKIVRANKALAEKLGKSPREIIGLPCYAWICGYEQPPAHCPHSKMLADGLPHSLEVHIDHLGGDYLVTVLPLRDEENQLIGTVHVARDITKRKRLEELLRESEERSRAILDNAKAGIMVIDAETHTVVEVNNLAVQMIGSRKDQITGSVCHNFVCPAGQGKCPITDLKQDIDNSERLLLRADGEKIPILKTVTSIVLGGRKHLIESFVDISEQKKSERERESARAFLQAIIDGVADSIVVFGLDRRVQLMNKAAREFSIGAFSEEEQNYCYKIFHHCDRPCEGKDHPCPIEMILQTRQAVTVNHTHFDKNGSGRVFEILASPVFDDNGEMTQIIETARDITEKLMFEKEKKKIEKQMYQEQKEQSIITLAGGIAHDFNNIIMSVMGNAELLKIELLPGTKEHIFAENIIKAGERMAELTSLLLAYAKTGFYHEEQIYLNKVIMDALALTRKGKALNIETRLELSDDVWPLYGDRGQLNQVFVNIFTNSFEAMENAGGCLTIETKNIRIDKSWECSHLAQEHPAGNYVYIRIEDTGPGMSEETRKRAFEPFFSKKFLGRGLGLAAVSGIVHKHNGCISVESEIGRGTVMHMYVPSAKEGNEAEKTGRKKQADIILVVDDELLILELLKGMLARMGFKVLTAISGHDALEIFRKEEDGIRMVILDIQMPDLDGKMVFKEIKKINADVKVLISSGYDQKTALSELGDHEPEGFIQKPFRIVELRKKLMEILEE